MNILNWLLSLFKSNKLFTGVLSDPRTAAQKAQDYLHSERTTAVTADPFGNGQITVSPYPFENQLQTSSCVPHAVTLAYGIERGQGSFVALSPMFPYRLRSNYSGEGSIPQNIFDILQKTGAPLFSTLPTPQVESQANAINLTQQMYTEAEIYRGNTYFKISPANDINTIAQVAQSGHAVSICLFAQEDEYSRQYPVILYPNLTQGQAVIQHEVCVLPNSGFIKDGVKYVAIQDSAWFGGWKLRYLSEAFIVARVTQSMYWVGTQVLSTGPRPHFTFTKSLTVGSKDEEVRQMQLLLISEGLLPEDLATGNFYGYTLAGVKAFQSKYASEILLPNGLLAPTGYWGPASIKKANQLCA